MASSCFLALQSRLNQWKIKDGKILEAIRRHTLEGSPVMSTLAQIVFVADFIEPGRDFRGVELVRKAALTSLNEAVLLKCSMIISHLLSKNMKVHGPFIENVELLLDINGMKIKKITAIFILFAVIGLSLISIMRLNQNPVSFFVLKNGSNVVKVYQVDVYFWGESASFKEVSLSPRQILEAEKIIGDKSLIELKQWSKSFGEFNFVVGLFDENNDLVFDWSRFFNSKTDNTISDLDQWDKDLFIL